MNNEKIEKIMQIIEKAFEDEIFSNSAVTSLGEENWIEGKDEFFSKVKNQLNQIDEVKNELDL
jgi:hypothetical protein